MRLVVLALLMVFVPGATAQSRRGNEWVGRRVITKFGTDLKESDGKFNADNERRESRTGGGERRDLRVYKVAEGAGEWLRLVAERGDVAGWVKLDQVIPFEKAEAYFTDLIRRSPRVPDLHAARGMIRHEMKDYPKAVADFDEALKLKPDDEVALNNRGMVRLAMKDYDGAIVDLDAATKVDPNYVLPHYNRGMAHRALKQYDEATADFTEAARLDPLSPRGLDLRAQVHLDRGEVDGAIADLDEAVKLAPKDASTRNERAIALARKGRFRDALDDLDEAIRLDPEHLHAHANRAWILATCPERAHRDGTEAVEAAEAALKLSDGKDPAVLRILAAALAESGQFARAVERQQEAIALQTPGPDRAEDERRLKLYKSRKPFRSGR